MTPILTAAAVIDLTKPAMLDRAAWVEILTAAHECQLVWEREQTDPWADGSTDSASFAPGPDAATVSITATAEIDGGWSRERRRPSRDVDRETFREKVTELFPARSGKEVYARILTAHSAYGNDDGTEVFPSNVRIAGELGLSRATVNRHVGTAVAEGWLRPTGRRGQAVSYRLTTPVAA